VFPRPFSHQLGFVNRGDPNAGLYVLMLLILGSQILSRRALPPTRQIVTILICFVIAVTIHEFMHAFAAWRLGDDTALRLGRLTFNPAMHFEPFGFFGMVMISLGFNFIGWGKPVPVSTNKLRGRGVESRNRSMALVAIAGPVSNIVMAGFAAIAIRLMRGTEAVGGDIFYFVEWFFWVNVLLASFNMIPIPPLDGHKILMGILPSFWYPILAPLERYGFLILFLLFFIGSRFGGAAITASMIQPLQSLLYRVLL
jgi:Zn-dependent protease